MATKLDGTHVEQICLRQFSLDFFVAHKETVYASKGRKNDHQLTDCESDSRDQEPDQIRAKGKSQYTKSQGIRCFILGAFQSYATYLTGIEIEAIDRAMIELLANGRKDIWGHVR